MVLRRIGYVEPPPVLATAPADDPVEAEIPPVPPVLGLPGPEILPGQAVPPPKKPGGGG